MIRVNNDAQKGENLCDGLSCSWRCLVKRIFSVSGSCSESLPRIILISWPVWMSSWTSIIRKTNPPSVWRVSRQRSEKTMAFAEGCCVAWRDLHLFPLHLSVPCTACSRRIWQRVSPNKVSWDREGWSVTPGGEGGWGVWRWQKEKRSFVASTEGYKPCDGWTRKKISADLTPMSSFSHLATSFAFILCPLKFSAAFLFDRCNKSRAWCGPCVTVWSCIHNLVY